MRLLMAQIDWRLTVANDPELMVLVDKFHDRDALIWSVASPEPGVPGSALIYSADPESGLVEFLLMRPGVIDPASLGRPLGFGGNKFVRRMSDGSTRISNDCWASRASCLPWRMASVEVAEHDNPNIFRSLALPAYVFAHMINSMGYHVIEQGEGETTFVISTDPEQVAKPEVN